PSRARSKPAAGSEADEIPPDRSRPPLAKPKAAAGSSTSGKSTTGLARRLERSSHGLFLRTHHLALEQARSDRQQHAVAQKPQHGEADDTGEHQIEPHPFLTVGDARTEPYLRADELGRKQHHEGVREPDADAAEQLRRGRRNEDAEKDRPRRRSHIPRRPDEKLVDGEHRVTRGHEHRKEA